MKLEHYLSGRKRKQQLGPVQKGAIVLEKRVSQDCLTLEFVYRKNGYPKDSLQIWECASHELSRKVFYSLFSNLFICFKETTIRNLRNIHKIKQGILCKVKILGQPDKNLSRKSLKLYTAYCILILDYSNFFFFSLYISYWRWINFNHYLCTKIQKTKITKKKNFWYSLRSQMNQFFLWVLPVLYSWRRWKESIKKGQGECFRNPVLLHSLQFFPFVFTYSFPHKH